MIANENVQRYPLQWPDGWKRTLAASRQRAKFSKNRQQLSVAQAIARLDLELGRLGAQYETLSTNVVLRLDGLPRSDQREPVDPGAAIYFLLAGKSVVLACDKWDRVADNIAAIAGHIEAMRAQERYGVGSLEQAFAGYAALPPKAEGWRAVLGFPPGARPTYDDIGLHYRDRARTAHPDAGGSHDAMARLNAARAAALTELQS